MPEFLPRHRVSAQHCSALPAPTRPEAGLRGCSSWRSQVLWRVVLWISAPPDPTSPTLQPHSQHGQGGAGTGAQQPWLEGPRSQRDTESPGGRSRDGAQQPPSLSISRPAGPGQLWRSRDRAQQPPTPRPKGQRDPDSPSRARPDITELLTNAGAREGKHESSQEVLQCPHLPVLSNAESIHTAGLG